MDPLAQVKLYIREADYPFFSDDDIKLYLGIYGTPENTAYHLLLIKAEDTSLVVSGLTMGDSSKYFKRLARMYRPNNSQILKGNN